MLLAVLVYCCSCSVGADEKHYLIRFLDMCLPSRTIGCDGGLSRRNGMFFAIRGSLHASGDILCNASLHNTCCSGSSAWHDCSWSWWGVRTLGLSWATHHCCQLVCVPTTGRAPVCSNAPCYTERSVQGTAQTCDAQLAEYLSSSMSRSTAYMHHV